MSIMRDPEAHIGPPTMVTVYTTRRVVSRRTMVGRGDTRTYRPGYHGGHTTPGYTG